MNVLANRTAVAAVMAAGLVIPAAAGGRAAQQAGTATGTLTVGTATFRLSRAAAFVDRASADAAKQTYRILVTERPLPDAIAKLAATAGANDDERQQLAVEMADQKVRGIEAIVGADKRVTRVNVYSPDSAMGLMLLEPSQFQAAALDGDKIGGKLLTERPIADSRIGKTIAFDVTFTASIARAATK